MEQQHKYRLSIFAKNGDFKSQQFFSSLGAAYQVFKQVAPKSMLILTAVEDNEREEVILRCPPPEKASFTVKSEDGKLDHKFDSLGSALKFMTRTPKGGCWLYFLGDLKSSFSWCEAAETMREGAHFEVSYFNGIVTEEPRFRSNYEEAIATAEQMWAETKYEPQSRITVSMFHNGAAVPIWSQS